jgi:phage gp37-like protein
MSAISQVEDKMILACTAALFNSTKNKSNVRTIETIPGGWTLDTLKRMLQGAPGVYISYLGGGIKDSVNSVFNDGRFDAVVVVDSAKELERRRGTKSQIGAYQIVEIIAPALHNLTVNGVGTLKVTNINNLFNESTFELGATIYAVQCQCPNMNFESPVDDTLDDFITFDVDYDIPVFVTQAERLKWLEENFDTSKPDATDEVTLEQE